MSALEIAVAIFAIGASVSTIVLFVIALCRPWVKTQREMADMNARIVAVTSSVDRIEKLLDRFKIYLR